MQVVWFKRDLRLADHRPLAEAARRGPVLPLFVVEPDFWRLPELSAVPNSLLIRSRSYEHSSATGTNRFH